MVSQGKTNQEIAKAFNIAEITVKKRLSQLYQRFGVTNRTGLIHKFKGRPEGCLLRQAAMACIMEGKIDRKEEIVYENQNGYDGRFSRCGGCRESLLPAGRSGDGR